MSDENEHVDVEIEEPKAKDENEPEVVVSDEVEKAQPEEAKAPVISADEGIQEMKRRLEMERRAREEAERRAYEAQQQAQRASSEVKDTNYQLVVNAIETVKGRSEQLKSAYKEAMSVGDYDKLAEIQEAMAINASHLTKLEEGKRQMDAFAKQPVEPVAPPPPRIEDVVENMARSVSPRSGEWIRSRKDVLRDERSIKKMFRAHEDAIDDGLEPDTDEYFDFIDARLGVRARAEAQIQSEATVDSPLSSASAPKKAPPPPAAPVSRGGSRPNVVRLTREQAEMAKTLGMSEAEYAKSMLELRKEGKIAS